MYVHCTKDTVYFFAKYICWIPDRLIKMANLALNSPSLFIYHNPNNFNSADPSSMKDACHISAQLNDFALY